MSPARGSKDNAASLVRLLTESAVSLSHTNPAVAREQAALARKVKLRFNVRLDPSLRRFTCRGCKGLLVPGVNARVRLGHGKDTIIRVTCADCGRVNRKVIKNQLEVEARLSVQLSHDSQSSNRAQGTLPK